MSQRGNYRPDWLIEKIERDTTLNKWTVTVSGKLFAHLVKNYRLVNRLRGFKLRHLRRAMRAMVFSLVLCYSASAQVGDTVSVKVDTSATWRVIDGDTLYIRGDTSAWIMYRQPGPDTVAVMLMIARLHREAAYYVTSVRGYQVLDYYGRHLKFLDKWKKDLPPSYYVWQVGALPARKNP